MNSETVHQNISPTDIIQFWFAETPFQMWFQSTAEFDENIKKKYYLIHQQAKAGELDHWKETAIGCLALVIILDQFPRNMFRNTPQAFSTDELALKISEYSLEHKFDQELSTEQRLFLYLPFEHSENLDHQKKSVELVKQIDQKDSPWLYYAEEHYKVIEKFGRFPHRNKILNRQSSREEEEFLKQPGSSF